MHVFVGSPLWMAPYPDLCQSYFRCDNGKLISYDHIMKMQAWNADKVLIESVIAKLTVEGKIIN